MCLEWLRDWGLEWENGLAHKLDAMPGAISTRIRPLEGDKDLASASPVIPLPSACDAYNEPC